MEAAVAGSISHPAAAAPPARSGTFSAGVLAKVGKPETLSGWVQICGRKLNSISPQVLLGKHAFSQVSISFSFSVLLWSAFTLFKNEIRTERRGPKMTRKRGGNWWQRQASPAGARNSGTNSRVWRNCADPGLRGKAEPHSHQEAWVSP